MIAVENLTKKFGAKAAVNDVSFTVDRGEVLGFLGPNGAGKSTTMRMITGFLPQTAGVIRVGGYDTLENPLLAKELIGYLPESAPLYTDMTVHGFLNFTAELRGLSGSAKRKAVAQAVEMCFLGSVIHQSVDTLSKGYRHRTCFAQAILHDPDVLIMDEPTDGLDPNQKHEVRTLIRRMGEKKAIIFSTHILEEVEAACDRAIIIDRGRIVANGTPDELKRSADNAGAIRLTIYDRAAADVQGPLEALPGASRVRVVGEENGLTGLRVYPETKSDGPALARSVADLVVREGWKIEELHIEEGRLDEVFRNITLSDTTTEGRKA